MFARRSAAFAFVALGLLEPTAGAQEIALDGPLTGAPVLILRHLYREHRVHLAFVPAVVIGDSGGSPLVLAARADFHPTDDVAMGLWGARGAAVGWAGAGQVTMVPAHGKLSLFGCCSVPMDLFLFGGIGGLTVDGQPRMGATFGGGMTAYAGDALAVTFEARALSSVVLVSVGVVLALPSGPTRECIARY